MSESIQCFTAGPGSTLQRLVDGWGRRAQHHPDEAERIASGEEATELRRWMDAMAHFRAKHVRPA